MREERDEREKRDTSLDMMMDADLDRYKDVQERDDTKTESK